MDGPILYFRRTHVIFIHINYLCCFAATLYSVCMSVLSVLQLKFHMENKHNFQVLIKRSSRRRCSVKKIALKNFANFARKHLCWSLFLKKLKVYSTLFFCEIYKNFKNTYFEHLWTTASKSLYFFSCSILWIFNIAILFSCQGVVFHNFVRCKE